MASAQRDRRGLREAVGANSAIVDDAMVDRVHALTSRPGNRSAFVDFANTGQPDRSAEIPSIAVPTLVLCRRPGLGGHGDHGIPAMKYFVASGEDRRLDPETRCALRGSFITPSDGVTHYELTGPDSGELAVLVGGLTIPLSYWDALAARLHTRGLRTLAYSAYGRGYSDRIQGHYDEALFVRQLAELTTALDLTPPRHVAGTSMGALVAMAYANLRPETVATLTIVGPAGLAEHPLPQRLLGNDIEGGFVARRFGRRLLEDHLGHNVRDPDRAEELVAMVQDAYRCEGSLYAFFQTLQDFPLHERQDLFRSTGKLGLPVLLVWGDDDQVTPITHLDTVRDLLRPRQTHVITECGHMAPFERPDDVGDLLASFTVPHPDRLEP
jgi:pimeloyl-ACP methyl ester carboxylesterase